MLKTSSKSDLRFQRYRQFCVAENNKIQKGISYYNWMYLKINIPDIRLIPLDRLTYVTHSNKVSVCN